MCIRDRTNGLPDTRGRAAGIRRPRIGEAGSEDVPFKRSSGSMALPCQRVWLCRTRILSVERQVEARGPIVWAFLVAQDHVREHFDTDYELPVVVDQSHLSELIHEVCDSRASGPYHLCQGLMAQQRNSRMGQRIVLP